MKQHKDAVGQIVEVGDHVGYTHYKGATIITAKILKFTATGARVQRLLSNGEYLSGTSFLQSSQFIKIPSPSINVASEGFYITLAGTAGRLTTDEENQHGPVSTDYAEGYCYHENFADHIDFPLADLVVDGYMSFETIEGNLHTIVEYETTRELTPVEVKELIKYTSGQLSDGIGEGFEQQSFTHDNEGNELYLSPWHRNQELKVIPSN